MGHLDQPLNTFWQLFFRPRRCRPLVRQSLGACSRHQRGPRSSRHDVASRSPSAFDPSTDLDYSPLIVTSDARSWSPAGPIGALADEPDALAIAAGGEAMALVSDGRVARVLASPGGLASWREIATENELATSQAGRACGLVSLTAVGYAAGQGPHRGELSS